MSARTRLRPGKQCVLAATELEPRRLMNVGDMLIGLAVSQAQLTPSHVTDSVGSLPAAVSSIPLASTVPAGALGPSLPPLSSATNSPISAGPLPESEGSLISGRVLPTGPGPLFDSLSLTPVAPALAKRIPAVIPGLSSATLGAGVRAIGTSALLPTSGLWGSDAAVISDADVLGNRPALADSNVGLLGEVALAPADRLPLLPSSSAVNQAHVMQDACPGRWAATPGIVEEGGLEATAGSEAETIGSDPSSDVASELPAGEWLAARVSSELASLNRAMADLLEQAEGLGKEIIGSLTSREWLIWALAAGLLAGASEMARRGAHSHEEQSRRELARLELPGLLPS